MRFLPAADGRRALTAFRSGWWVVQRILLDVLVVGAAGAIIIGVDPTIIGVPIVVPMVVLTFFAAFPPLVGAVVAGATAPILALSSAPA